MTTRVKDRGANRVIVEIGKAHRHPVKVGVLGDEDYEESGLTVAMVAAFHELGLGVPQRSWLRGWIDENKDAIRDQCINLQRGVLKGRITEKQASGMLGDWIVGQIQARISAGIEPALAQSTIDEKGSSTPLIDTGQLRSSIARQVE